jgi:hypothetical protein
MDTKEEIDDMWEMSVELSNIYGPQIVEKVDGRGLHAATTAAILLSSFCISCNISMHSTVDILMSAYKGVLNLRNEDEE